jgi:hypothetical protein
MTVGGVPQEYTFITFGIKFTQILPISKNIAFTFKSFEILNCGLLSSPNLIGSRCRHFLHLSQFRYISGEQSEEAALVGGGAPYHDCQ